MAVDISRPNAKVLQRMPCYWARTPAASSGGSPVPIFSCRGDGVRLLVTRPPPDGERTAAALRAHGHDALLAPVLRMEALECALPDRDYVGTIMTSANAARAIAGKSEYARLAALPAFVVGQHTAGAAQAAGFQNVHCADGNRRDLARLLRERFDVKSGPLLYLAGEDRA